LRPARDPVELWTPDLEPTPSLTLGAHVRGELALVKAELCFLGVHRIHPELGRTTAGFDEATIKRAMMNASAEVVALVTANKFGTAPAHKFGEISDLDVSVAEDTPTTRQFLGEGDNGTRLLPA